MHNKYYWFSAITSVIALLIAGFVLFKIHTTTTNSYYRTEEIDYVSIAPPSVQLVEYSREYSEKYGVPLKLMMGCAKQETGFRSVYQWSYNPAQTSKANALGPYQVMYSTAKSVLPNKKFTKQQLKTNIKLNTEASAKFVGKLKKSRDWLHVYSYYNQGVKGDYSVNSYARKIVHN